MDYTIKHRDNTSFTYVLPFTENSALVEFTFLHLIWLRIKPMIPI